MPRAHANGIELEYEIIGADRDPPLLLIMGLGCQLVHWDDDLCQTLAGRGFRVIRFDNRDVGLSTKLHDFGLPNVMRMAGMRLMGLPVRAPYSLRDMAADTVGLLDALALPDVHVVGASLGGMVAQVLATQWPHRVRSLCSWMSTTGQTHFRPTAAATRAVMGRAPDDIAARIEQTVASMRVLGSKPPLFEEEAIRARATRALARNTERAGSARQLAAVMAASPRTAALRAMRGIPTLVLHGEADPLVPVAAGRATARAIAGARLHTFPGVGHDIPRPIWPEAIEAIVDNAARAAVLGAAAFV